MFVYLRFKGTFCHFMRLFHLYSVKFCCYMTDQSQMLNNLYGSQLQQLLVRKGMHANITQGTAACQSNAATAHLQQLCKSAGMKTNALCYATIMQITHSIQLNKLLQIQSKKDSNNMHVDEKKKIAKQEHIIVCICYLLASVGVKDYWCNALRRRIASMSQNGLSLMLFLLTKSHNTHTVYLYCRNTVHPVLL